MATAVQRFDAVQKVQQRFEELSAEEALIPILKGEVWDWVKPPTMLSVVEPGLPYRAPPLPTPAAFPDLPRCVQQLLLQPEAAGRAEERGGHSHTLVEGEDYWPSRICKS